MIQIRDHDWEAAGKLYQRAIESGESPNAMISYALFYLQNIGHAEKAIKLHVEAEKRDPLHAGYKANLANLYVWNGNPEAAARKAREALELKPEHLYALMGLIDAYTATGNYAGVQQILEEIPLALQEHPRILARVAMSYLSHGDYVKAREIYQELLRLEPVRLLGAAPIFTVAVNLGEIEQAIDLMETSVDLNMWNQFWTANWLMVRQKEGLKDHPRYLAHLRRMRLDERSLAELHRRMSFK